jgi:hypothetical protein
LKGDNLVVIRCPEAELLASLNWAILYVTKCGGNTEANTTD